MVLGDKKFYDFSFGSSAIGVTASISPVSQVNTIATVGTSGMQSNTTSSFYLLGRSIQIRMNIYAGIVSSVPIPSTVRVMILQDKEVTSTFTAPTQTDILVSGFDSPLNELNCKRFWILLDKMVSVGQSPSVRTLNIFRRIPFRTQRIGQQVLSNGTTIPRENQIYVLLVSDTSVSGNEPIVTYFTRFRYNDT